MDEYLNNRQNEILWNMLANPANNGHFYVENLRQLVEDYPHSGILYALLSHADSGQGVSHAAAYLDPRALYALMHSPDGLGIVADDKIVQQLSDTAHYGTIVEEDVQHESGPEMNDTLEKEHHFGMEPETATIEPDYIPYQYKSTEEQLPVEDETEVNNDEHDLDDKERPTDTIDQEQAGPLVDEQQEIDPFYEEIIETGPVAESIPEDERVTHVMPFEEEDHLIPEAVVESPADEPVTHEASNKQEDEPETGKIREDELVTESPTFELAEPPRGIEDDVYDEIVGIENISFTQHAAKSEIEMPPTEETSYIDEEELPAAVTGEVTTESPVQKERELNMNDEAEKLIVGNIAATDYFAFDKAFSDRKQAEPAEVEPMVTVSTRPEDGTAHVETSSVEEKKDVSKYNDDTLPYTFMWWLNKTRKEHAGIYQPFKLDTTQAIRQHGADELQQQYYENIFHLSGFEELERGTPAQPVEFDLKTKEDRIIKRFIVEEPHITTPSSDKLDTENKAKKSSEDQNEFVTETLARIYSDQMLYHKAISAYKKLMLKFPEKRRYFADQIEQLERKSN